MQEEITQKMIGFTTNGAKLSKDILAKVFQLALAKMRETQELPKVGRNQLKRLIGRDGGAEMIEIANRLPEFEKIAREYKIHYHVRKGIHPETGKTRWQIFFKSKQSDALTAAFNKYTQLLTTQEKRPSLRTRLQQHIKAAQALTNPDREKHRDMGGKER